MKTIELNISRRVGLVDLLIGKGFEVGVEIGTDRGGYAKDICDRAPNIRLFTIDPWLPYTEGNIVKDESKMKEIQKEARLTLSGYPKCHIIHNTSDLALGMFNDSSLDFVFIDGDHRYDQVLKDITEWTKKVRSGGIIAGHDYVQDEGREYGVVKAVNEYVESNKIEDLFILRRGSFVPCWMFEK